MAILLRRLLLRHRTTAFSLLRNRSLSSFSVASDSISSPPEKALYSPPWQWNLGRRFSSASPPISAEMDSERLSSAKESEEYMPRGLEAEDIEGCDFNHWLIVVNFPKNPRPSSEEMIRFYEETCAKTLNLSLEEAKKKIYATSTSNYTGFHVQVTEMESEKFNGQPGVVFVLPDSYIDKENKEYGGDRYINGVIIPRPRVSRRRIWDNAAPPPPRQQSDRSNSQEQTATSSYSQEQQRDSPPFTHEGVTGRTTNGAPPSHHPPPQPPPQQSYYAPPPPPPPNYAFQRNNYNHAPPSTRHPYQQGNDSFAPNRGNYSQGVTWNYAPPPPPLPPPPPPPPHFNWHHHSQQVGPYSWTVDRGYPGPAHGPHQPNWPGQPHPGQSSQCQVYPGQPYPGHSSQSQVYPGQPSQNQVYEGQPYPGQPSQNQVYPGQHYPGQPYPGQKSERQGYGPNGDYQDYGSHYGPLMGYWR